MQRLNLIAALLAFAVGSVACAAGGSPVGGTAGLPSGHGGSQPVVNALSPASAVQNSGPFALTLNGSGFDSGAVITVDGVALPTSVISAAQLSATVPGNLLLAQGELPVTVTDGDGQGSGTSTFTVAPPPLSLTPGTLKPATVGVAYSANVAAAGGTPPYTFTSTGFPLGNLGAFVAGNALVLTGVPALPQSAAPVTVTVRDSAQPASASFTAQYSLAVNASSPVACALAGGKYAFLLEGTDSHGSVTAAGSAQIAADGSITGAFDFKDPGQLLTNQPILQSAGNCVAATGVPNAGVITLSANPALTFNFVLNSEGTFGWLTQANATSTLISGRIVLQNPAQFGAFFGSMAFGLEGVDAQGGRYAAVGALCTDDTLSATYLQADLDDAGTLALMSNGASAASFSAPDGNGRSASISPFVFANGEKLNLSAYVVNAAEAFVIESSNLNAGAPLLQGMISGQPGSVCLPRNVGGTFVTAGLNPGVFYMRGIDSGTRSVYLGRASAELIGGAQNQSSGLLWLDGTSGRLTQVTTQFSALNGRGIMSYTDPTGAQQAVSFYPDGAGHAYLLQHSADVPFGQAQMQSAITYNADSIGGAYAFGTQLLAPVVPMIQPQAVQISNPPAIWTLSGASTGYSLDNSGIGRGVIAGLSSNLLLGATQVTFYVIGPGQIALLGAGTNIGFLIQ